MEAKAASGRAGAGRRQMNIKSNGPRTHQRFQKLRETTADKSASIESTEGIKKLSARRKNLAQKVLPSAVANITDEGKDASEEISTTTFITSTVSTTTLSTIDESTTSEPVAEIAADTQGAIPDTEALKSLNAIQGPIQDGTIKHERFRNFREKNFLKSLGKAAKENIDIYLDVENHHTPNPDL